ncbi:ATP-binding protein [Tumebacillus flagellatus]|uniref:ATP-binding protein n=1 Tax=Tumebacillus flagellatus TaxID=1157490 RepID=UPI00057004D0|nr:sensor histidine kinase [Tumebacillus flagellatus]
MRLQTKLILLITSLLLLILGVFAWRTQRLHAETEQEQIGVRAVTLANTIAQIPDIRNALATPRPQEIIQPLVERIRTQAGAEFIVVANSDGIRFSHPNPAMIGQKMGGEDETQVLRDRQTTITVATASLGPSLRGKVPILDEHNNVLGLVSVGYSLQDIDKLNAIDRNRIIWLSALALLVGLAGAVMIANGVKKSILGLEPREIGRLYQEKQSILESIREGILAINQDGVITTANPAALPLLHLPQHQSIIGRRLLDVLPDTRLLEVARSGHALHDEELIAGEDILLVNRIPVYNPRGQVIGAVASFRDKSELSKLTEELSQVLRYADSLRAQTHEYSNKLHTISGLIQLESYQEAIDLITHESNIHLHLVQFLMKEVPDPILGGLLIGKYNRANEMKVQLNVDPDSTFTELPEHIDRNVLVTILGNLIDNALEAVLMSEHEPKLVNVFLTDIGDDLILEVEDTGPGVSEADVERIFEIGYSTKPGGEHRGFGLPLVKKSAADLGGYVTCTANHPVGSVFTVAIPKWR